MTLSSMVVSRDLQEVSVLECILGGLHIGVDVESEPERARAKLAKSKIDALIIDCDLTGAAGFLKGLQNGDIRNAVPLIIVSGSSGRKHLESKGASFVFEKPISVEQAVHTLSAARNMILDERLRYHRATLDVPVSLTYAAKNRQRAHLMNLSQGGIGVRLQQSHQTVGRVKVNFKLPGTRLSMKFVGEVAWKDKWGNAGIRFVEASSSTKRELQLWLERQYFMP
jgi:DNA-binding response OmpR family regulator